MKNKKLLLVFVLVALFNTRVFAATCSNSEKKDLRVLANEAQVKYILKPAFTDYEKLKNRDRSKTAYNAYFFDIIVYDVHNEFTVKIDKEIIKPTNGEAYFKNIYSFGGVIVKAYLYYNGSGPCHAELIRTISFRLPFYNVYSIYPECEGYVEKVKLCTTNYNSYKYSESEFREEVAKQIAKYEEKQQQNNKPEEEKKSLFEKIKEWYMENIKYTLPSTISILLLIVLIFIKIKWDSKHRIKIDLGDMR